MAGVRVKKHLFTVENKGEINTDGAYEKVAEKNGSKIRILLSFSNCLQLRRAIAKDTPMPEIIKRMGIRQMLITPIRIHSFSRESSFWINPIIYAQGWKLTRQ